MLKNCERIIQTLDIEFVKAEHGHIQYNHTEKDKSILDNTLIHVHTHNITVEVEGQTFRLQAGDLIFISSGSTATIHYHNPSVAAQTPREKEEGAYLNDDILYESQSEDPESFEKHFSLIQFRAKAYRALDFFQFIGLPPFVVKSNLKALKLLETLFIEIKQDKVGKGLILQSTTVHILVSLIRYILSPQNATHNLSEKLLIKIDALTDLRLVKIFQYITENISSRLTNAIIAEQVGLNKDYIGQFFIKHTYMNLQTYVQMVRLNEALKMLKTTDLRVRAISQAVGFRDFAYFCKQFRIVFGDSPKKVQKKYISSL